jgi:hypothetical protein
LSFFGVIKEKLLSLRYSKNLGTPPLPGINPDIKILFMMIGSLY